MFGKIGPVGLFGLLLMLAGIAVVAYENLIIGAGFALLVAGIGLLVYGLVSTLMGKMGLGGAF